jgi:hypothetical protein
LLIRLGISAAIVGLYLLIHGPVVTWLDALLYWLPESKWKPGESTPQVLIITLLFASLVATWWRFIRDDPRYHAPLFITYILAMADASFGILLNHPNEFVAKLTGDRITGLNPTFMAILAAISLEIMLSKFMTGKWPHLASAYISGISAGILCKSLYLWPFVATAFISIASKYVLRIRGRHLWNPTNFGMSAMLLLASNYMSPLSVEIGNSLWPVVIIWTLGSFILYRFRLLHLPWIFVATFVPLALLRSVIPGVAGTWETQLAPMTSPMFQLFIFFMITDPKTITKPRWSQCLVAVLIGVADMVLRLFRDPYSLFHALFIVGPAANLIEIWWNASKVKAVVPSPVVAVTPALVPATAAAPQA